MTEIAFRVLRLLADGEFHSGAAVARTLGVSRGTVWNAVRALEAAGLDVYRVRARGYRLSQPLSMLDAAAVAEHAAAANARFELEIVDIAGSTNTLLMQRAVAGAPNGTVIAAEWQHSGRGRLGRDWHTGLGGAITFSLLRRFAQGGAALAGLTLAVGVALRRAMTNVGAADVQLKWPNDVLWRGRKLAGVLVELQGDALGPSAAVIGIGINVRLSEPVLSRIGQAAADLETACGGTVDRSVALGVVLAELARVLDRFSRDGFSAFRAEWESHHAYQGRHVYVTLPGGRTDQGIARGIGEDGALLLESGNAVRRLHSAEVSLRPGKPESVRHAVAVASQSRA